MIRPACLAGIICVLVLCPCSPIPARAQGVLYVDGAAPGVGDGTTWGSAFRDLQDALAVATPPGVGGTDIRVARGLYLPDRGFGQTPGDRDATFTVPAGVSLRGGYAGGSRPDPDLRDVNAYPTLLSGDLAGDDLSFPYSTDENCRHVVSVAGNLAQGTVIDGLIITGGSADGASGTVDGQGGGVFVRGSARLTNCHVVLNGAAQGGGIYLGPSGRLTLTGCTIMENGASSGGGLFADMAWNLWIDACAFNGNAASSGGAVYCQASAASVTSSTFTGNRASPDGPTFYSDLLADMLIVNCTVVSAITDSPWQTGYTLHCADPSNPYSSGSARISNCILWNDGPECRGLTNYCSVEYCDVKASLGYAGGTAIRSVDPGFVRLPRLGGGPIDYGDLHLQPSSPCIDAGNSVDPPAPMSRDMDGHARRIDDPTVPNTGTAALYSPAIDIGAHELHQWAPADFNFDHHVNHLDLAHLEVCGLGAAMAQEGPACLNTDLDRDGDVDGTDFGFFQRCLSGGLAAEPFCMGEHWIEAPSHPGPCQHYSLTLDEYPYCGDPWMEYIVSGPGELTVIRHNAVYNCCPDKIETVVSRQAGRLHFEEQETASHPCVCLCCYDVETKVNGLWGSYDIEYCWAPWHKPMTCTTATITVP